VARSGLNARVQGSPGEWKPHGSVRPFPDVWARIGHRAPAVPKTRLPAVRRLVLELTDDEYERIDRAALNLQPPDYIRAVVTAVLDYRENEPEPDADSAR
jgi:hypothetical protein